MYLFWNAAARSDCSFGELVPLIAGEAVLCALARPVMRPPSEGLMAMVGLDPSTFFEAGLAPFGLFASVLAVAPCIHAFAPGGCVPPAAVILFAPIALIRALAWFSEWSFDMRLRWNPCEQMRSHWQGGMWYRGYIRATLSSHTARAVVVAEEWGDQEPWRHRDRSGGIGRRENDGEDVGDDSVIRGSDGIDGGGDVYGGKTSKTVSPDQILEDMAKDILKRLQHNDQQDVVRGLLRRLGLEWRRHRTSEPSPSTPLDQSVGGLTVQTTLLNLIPTIVRKIKGLDGAFDQGSRDAFTKLLTMILEPSIQTLVPDITVTKLYERWWVQG